MASVIKVNEIQNSSGTTALSIDSTGQPTFPKAKVPSFHVYRSANQTVAHGTPTDILFDGNHFLYGWTLDTGTGILTAGADAAGIYQFQATSRANTSSDNNTSMKILLSGSSDSNGIGSQYCYSEYYQGMDINVLYEISSGDTLRMRVSQSTGSDVIFGGFDAGYNVRFHGFRVSK
jgi:hypothetical protein